MPAIFFIEAQLGMVFSKVTGAFSYGDAAAHMQRLLQHPGFRPDFSQLLDLREAADISISAEEMDRLAATAVFGANAKRALVVSSNFQFGMARMFAIYRENHGERGVEVFRQMPEALAWLNVSQEPDWEMISSGGVLADNGGVGTFAE